MDFSEYFAYRIGVPVEAFRLLVTLLAGYPIAEIYYTMFINIPVKTAHHMYFVLCGMSLCFYNYSFDIYHSFLAIIVTYLLVAFLRHKPRIMLTINFVFHMSYLLLGYFFTASNEYDILWTMPHCILTLRMIGFGFDVADGLKPEENLSKEQKERALKKPPTFLQLLAYAYFPSGFLVGPQFPFRRYQRFINGEFREHTGCVREGFKRLGMGVLYLTICQVGLAYLPDKYFLTTEFAEQSFIKRILLLGFWAKFTLYKYISCWLFAEGSLMYIGFTYKGQDAFGNPDFSGCSNVKLFLFETGNTMQHYVQCFNVNTNEWVAHYIFKRLKFLNNRNISYAAALGFLAVWHGYHSGYYMSFLMEYMIVTTEKQIERVYTKNLLPKYGERLNNSKLYPIAYFLCLKSYNIIYMGWCLTSFVFLKYERWITVYRAVNYFGFIYMIIWAVIYNTYKLFWKPAPRSRQAQSTTTQVKDVQQEAVKPATD